MQFVCEAVMVAGLGGAVGLAVVVALGSLANTLVPAEIGVSVVVFTPGNLMIGLSCATLTGLIFDFAPARRAAGMDPVVALRV